MITKIVIENVKKLITDNLSELIDDAVNQYIYDTVEEEVTKHTEYKISGILEHISKVHGISLDLLLRDAPLAGMNGICKGSKIHQVGLCVVHSKVITMDIVSFTYQRVLKLDVESFQVKISIPMVPNKCMWLDARGVKNLTSL